MRMIEAFYLLGMTPRTRTYGSVIERHHLPRDGAIDFARWLHPRSSPLRLDQAEIDELRGFLGEGDLAIDIGAHVGKTALPAALACGPSGMVLALEPNPHTFRVLEENARLNRDKTRIVPLPFAATAEDRRYTFRYADPGLTNGGAYEKLSAWRHGSAFRLDVEGRNLDRLLRAQYADRLPRLRYIKIDVEGSEPTVLASLRDIIRERRPYVKAEIYKLLDEPGRRWIARFFAELGYAVHKYGGPGLMQGEQLAEADMMRWRHFDIFAVP